MAISETSLRDVLLFTFDEINAQGGVLGHKIEPIVVDGASNWDLFAEKAKQLLEQDEVAVVFGCWTSVSRKSVLPVFEKNNGLLFYPVQYEGEEESQNVAYTAEAVNQQATPAVDYLLEQGYTKFYLLGTDYVYPQTTNLVLLEYLLSKGVSLENIGGGFRKDESGNIISAGKYTGFGHTDYQQIVAEIKQFAAGGTAAVISTLNGDTNVPFFKEYAAAGLSSEECPVVSFSISEDEFRGLLGLAPKWTDRELNKGEGGPTCLTLPVRRAAPVHDRRSPSVRIALCCRRPGAGPPYDRQRRFRPFRSLPAPAAGAAGRTIPQPGSSPPPPPARAPASLGPGRHRRPRDRRDDNRRHRQQRYRRRLRQLRHLRLLRHTGSDHTACCCRLW